jgi:hypothetical protein
VQRRQTYLTAGLYVILSTAFCWPFFAQPLASGSGDWDVHLFYYAAVLRNAAFGDLPFWNPWYCGGNVLWANPQVSVVSPVYLLSLVMPITLAMKLNVLAHYVAGFLGMHVLLRRVVGVRSPAVVVYLASLFVFAGAITLRVRSGHTVFLPVFLLPWVVYCFWQATAGFPRALVAGSAILGFMVLNGGMHVLPLAVVLLGVLGLGALAAGRIRPLVVAAAMVVLGCAFAAPKIAPVVSFVGGPDINDTRPVKDPDYMSMEMLRISLFDGSQTTRVKVSPGVQLYGWHEYGNYMGWLGAGLAMASAVWILAFGLRGDWRAVSAAVGLIVVLVIAAGQFATYAPASVMRDLPFFSSFRIPSRYLMLVPLVGAMCMAFAARALEAARGPIVWRRLIEILCIVGVCEIGVVNRQHLREIFILPVDAHSRLFERTTPTVVPHPVVTPGPRVHRTFMLDSLLAGVSPLNCYEPLQVRKVAAPGPIAIRGEGSVTISGSTFSPNRVEATAAVGGDPARAVLNQNFARGWSTNVGPAERDPASDQPSVMLPAGYSGPIVFTFVPPGLWMGSAISIAALSLSIVVWRRARRQPAP